MFVEDCIDIEAELNPQMDLGLDRLIIADAIDKGNLVIFNSFDNHVKAGGYEITQEPNKFELGVITFMAFDHVYNQWFIYRNKSITDILNREVVDHFADSMFRKSHKAL